MKTDFTPVTGSIQAKKGKLYAVINIWQNGKRKQKWVNTGFIEKGEKKKANDFLNNLLFEYNHNKGVFNSVTNVTYTNKNDTLFSDYLITWLNTKKTEIDVITYQGYKRMIDGKLKKYFDSKMCTISEITASDILSFYESLYEMGFTGNTALHYHAIIRQALSYAYRRGIIKDNIISLVDSPRKKKFIPSFYREKEALLMLTVFLNDPFYIPIMMSTYYGLTRSEVLGLRWSSIDFDKKSVRIDHKIVPEMREGKIAYVGYDRLKTNARRRTLPLIDSVAKILLEEKKKQEENKKLLKKSYCLEYRDYLCVDDMGKLLNPSTLTSHFRRILKKNGLRTIRFHDLRHTCASLLVANGVSIKQIQIWLGHSNYSTTADIYSHLESSVHLESANCMERILQQNN